jgi:PAS domain S-box-containing protein
LVAPEDREFVRDRTLRREHGENVPALYEFMMLRKDGVRILVEVNAIAIEWEGRPATLSFRRDTTERKQMEVDIRDMARFPSENPNPVLRLDSHGTVVSANESSKKLLQSWSSRIGQVAPKYWCDLVTEVLHTGQSRDIDLELNERSYTFLAKPFIEAGYVNLYGRDITERKRAEEAVRESEARFRQAMGATSDGLWDWNIVTDEIYFSPAYNQILGYEPGELSETIASWKGLVHPDDLDRVVGLNEDCIENRIPRFETEFRMRTKSGEWKWILGRGTASARDSNGRALRLIGTHQDITERKRLEEELKNHSEQYRSLFENSGDGILLTAPDGTIFAANPAACQMLERTEEEICAVGMEGVIDPADHKLHAAMTERARTGRFAGELTYKRKDGTRFPAEVATSVFKDKHGRERACVILRDVTDRKRMEEELKRYRTKMLHASDEKYRVLVLTSPDAVTVADLDGTITDVSDRTLELLGFSNAEELVGKNTLDFIAPEDRERATIDLQRALKETRTKSAEYVLLRKDGTRLPIERNAATIKDGEGKSKAFITTMRDISERKLLEEMREQFLAHVTHELRTPLGPLKVHVEYALAGRLGPLSEKMKSSLQVMKMDTDRLMELTDQLLDIQRFQSSNFGLNLQPSDLREIINQSVKEAQVALDAKKQRLHVEVPDGPLPISGDPTRLSQVMTNLLSNASKFTPENGRITLRLEDETEAFKIGVSDTGIGIRKENLAMVFLPFATIQKPTWMQGAGLGLRITKGIVEAHGGKIWVESDGEGKGTTFIFTLPKLPHVPQT